MARPKTGRRYRQRESTPRLVSPPSRTSPVRRTPRKTSAVPRHDSPGPWSTDSGSGSEYVDYEETAVDSDTSMGDSDGEGRLQPVGFDFAASARHGRELQNRHYWLIDAEDEEDEDEEDEEDEDLFGEDLAQEALCDGITVTPDEDLLGEDDEPLYNGNIRPVEEWQRKLARRDDELLDKKNYSPGTKRLIRMAEEYWVMFCTTILKKKDPATFYQGMSSWVAYCFLDWMLCQRKTPNGKDRRGIKKRSTLVTFWCAFRLAFQRAAKHKISRYIDHVQIENATAELCDLHGLEYEKRPNRSMTIEDLKIQLDTTLCTTEKTFDLGEQRILAILFLLLLAPAGSRPRSILDLRFGDLEIVLRRDGRDPTNGPKRLLIRMKLEFTKRYLGPKATKTFHIPEIIQEPNFILNPHVFLLGILFRLQAFQAPGLNANPDKLQMAKIHEGESEIRLPIKKELRNMPVFRRAEKGPLGWYMSDKPMGISQMTYAIHAIGKIIGFESNTICYSLRYMAGNGLDQSGSVSDSLRNLVLDHSPGSNTFQEHYLSRNVCVDLWAVQRGVEAQTQIVHESTSHGYNRSSRRPMYLTKEQSASVNADPKVLRMERGLKALRKRTAEYGRARRKIDAYKVKLRRALQKRIREEWTDAQAVDDFERQLKGLDFAPAEDVRRPRPRGAGHERLIEALHVSLICDIETQRLRRTRAIQAIVEYCGVEEVRSLRVVEDRPAPPPVELQAENPAEELRKSVLISAEGERLLRCFICVGKAITLSVEDPKITGYCRPFAGPPELTRHFRSAHLSRLGAGDQTRCPICPGVLLQNKKHLQRHSEDVHGIRTDQRGVGQNWR